MRKSLFPLLVLLCGTTVHSADNSTILVFGDSLSAGYGIGVDNSWVSLLQARLGSLGYEHRVVNASISGETTEGGVARIEQALQRFQPELIILELGANDGLRGFPPQRLRSNLDKIVVAAKNSGAAVVLLAIKIPLNYGARYSEAFETTFRDVAAEHGLPWIEFFMEGVALNEELLLADGIHPNLEAQALLLENAWPIISASLGVKK